MLRYLSTGFRPFGDYPMAPHKRFNWEFYAVVAGRLAPSFSEGGPVPFASDRLWLFSPDCEHGWQAEPGHGCEVVVFHYSSVPAELQRLTHRHGFAAVPLRAADKRRLLRLANSLAPHVQQSTVLGDFLAERGLLDLSLVMLQRAACGQATPSPEIEPAGAEAAFSPVPSSGADDTRVLAAERWFRLHLSQQPTANDVARALGVSPSHLRRLFWRVRHRSPRETFNRLRLDHATQLLAQSDLKLAGVASESGFASPSHFCQAFKKAFGTSPNVWRRLAYIQYQPPLARTLGSQEMSAHGRVLSAVGSGAEVAPFEPDAGLSPGRGGAHRRRA